MGILRRRVAAAAVAALLVSACAGGAEPTTLDDLATSSPDPDPSLEPDAEVADDDADEDADGDDASSASLAPDRFPDDPAQIDEAYVSGVLDELDRAFGEFAAHVAEAGEVGEVGTLLLQAFATERLAAHRSELFSTGHDQFLRDDPSAPTTTVLEVRTADLGCVNVLAERDMGPVFSDPGSADTRWSITLLPAPEGSPVPWLIAGEQLDDDVDPPDECADLREDTP